MLLTLCTSVDPADWIVHTSTPPRQLLCFGPSGFEAYVRLRYIRDPEHPGEHEADVDLPADHPSDNDRACRAVSLLSAHPQHPDGAYFCLWNGYGSSETAPADVLVHLPHRDYILLSGPLAALDEWETVLGPHPAHPFLPAFV